MTPINDITERLVDRASYRARVGVYGFELSDYEYAEKLDAALRTAVKALNWYRGVGPEAVALQDIQENLGIS